MKYGWELEQAIKKTEQELADSNKKLLNYKTKGEDAEEIAKFIKTADEYQKRIAQTHPEIYNREIHNKLIDEEMYNSR